MQAQKTPAGIGTLNEKPLHESLKQWYARSGDRFEVPVDGFIVDHPVRLVYPIPGQKWIVKEPGDADGPVGRRKSPKRGGFECVFEELVSIPALLANPNFSMELLLIQEEEVRRHDSTHGWRRRGWVTHERRLLKVVEQRVLRTPADMDALIPPALADPFTTSDLAIIIARPRRLAQRMVYCLRLMGCLTPVGKRARATLYTRSTG